MTAPRREGDAPASAWENVPGDLDRLFGREEIDPAGSRSLEEKAGKFLEDARLEGTDLVDTQCGARMCRVKFVHDTVQDYKAYQRANSIFIWFGESNYFDGAPSPDGTWSSSFWMGTNGYQLPLQELYDRQKTLLE